MREDEPGPVSTTERPRRWYEQTWVLVLVCLVATGISVASVVDLLSDDPEWLRSVVFALFGPSTLIIAWSTVRQRPPR